MGHKRRILITGGSGLGSAASHLHRLSRVGNHREDGREDCGETHLLHFGRDDVWWLMGRELDRLCDESTTPIVIQRCKNECDVEEVVRTLRVDAPAKAWIAGPAPLVERARRAVAARAETMRLQSVDFTHEPAS